MWNFPLLEVPHQTFGTEYGQWPIIDDLISPKSIVYSVGCGTDISWDLALIKELGVEVYAFDPTPVSLEYIQKNHGEERGFVFSAVGLSDKNESLELSAPVVTGGASFYLGESPNTSAKTVSVPCKDLRSLMDERGHDHLDVLKMDIEGAEYRVIDYLIANRIHPKQLLIEFHHEMYGYTIHDTYDYIKKLRAAGYAPFYRSQTYREMGFLKT